MKTVKLGEYIKTVTPKTKIQAKKFLEAGRYPIVSQEAGQVNGYWNDTNDVMHFDKPVIIFGDHTRCIKYIDFNFVAGADGTKILQTPDDLDPRFFYHWLLAHPVEHLGYARHFRLLKEMEIEIPSLEEQRRVVEKLDAAFERISAAEVLMRRNLDNIAALQKSTLHKYLSADDSTHTYRLGDICMFRPKKSEIKTKLDGKELVSFAPMEMLPINQKYFSAVEEKPLEKVYSSYTYFQEADVIYAKITPCFENGKLSIAKGLKNGVGFGSSEFVPIRCSEKILPDYLYYFLLQPGFIQNGIPVMHGASGHRRVPNEYTENLEIGLPSLEEQRRIVAKLDAILSDSRELESQYTKKLTKLTDLRQSLLQEAFNTTK